MLDTIRAERDAKRDDAGSRGRVRGIAAVAESDSNSITNRGKLSHSRKSILQLVTMASLVHNVDGDLHNPNGLHEAVIPMNWLYLARSG